MRTGPRHRTKGIQSVGVNVGWNNDPDDVRNREVFEEQVAIFKAATSNEQFSFRGKHYVLPPDGLEFRGEPVTSLSLVPRPSTVPVRRLSGRQQRRQPAVCSP